MPEGRGVPVLPPDSEDLVGADRCVRPAAPRPSSHLSTKWAPPTIVGAGPSARPAALRTSAAHSSANNTPLRSSTGRHRGLPLRTKGATAVTSGCQNNSGSGVWWLLPAVFLVLLLGVSCSSQYSAEPPAYLAEAIRERPPGEGLTLYPTNGPWGGFGINDFAQVGSTVFAATEAGLFRSDDEGQTWRLSGPGDRKHESFSNVVTLGQSVFAGAPGELYRSDDSGESWKEITPERFESNPPFDLATIGDEFMGVKREEYLVQQGQRRELANRTSSGLGRPGDHRALRRR